MSLYTEHERDTLLPLLEHVVPEGTHPAEAKWRTLAQKLKAERDAREVDLIRLARTSFGHIDAGEPITRRVDKILAEIEKLKAIPDKTIDHKCHIARVERDAGALRVKNRQLNRRAQLAESAFQQLVRLAAGGEGTSIVIKYLYDQLTTKITRLQADLDESRGGVHHWHHMHQIAKRELAQVHESLRHWMTRARQAENAAPQPRLQPEVLIRLIEIADEIRGTICTMQHNRASTFSESQIVALTDAIADARDDLERLATKTQQVASPTESSEMPF